MLLLQRLTVSFQCHYGGMETIASAHMIRGISRFNATTGGWRLSNAPAPTAHVRGFNATTGGWRLADERCRGRRCNVSMPLRGDGDFDQAAA